MKNKYTMKKHEIILTLNSLIKHPDKIDIKGENGEEIKHSTELEKKIFNRGIEVGLSIAIDIVKNL